MSGYRPTHHRITGRFHVISFIVVKDCTELMLTLLLDFVATYQEMSTTALSADPAVAVPLLTINGWILMQRLVKGGPVTFNQSWVAYREGFGSATANESYWLGLEKVYRLTQLSSTALRVEVYAQITSNYTLLYFADLTKTERNQLRCQYLLMRSACSNHWRELRKLMQRCIIVLRQKLSLCGAIA